VKKPRLHVTKWLGDIPAEAECTLCPGVMFKGSGAGHRPDRAEYVEKLQREFDAHLKTAHAGGDGAAKAGS
jgi:hypothetical protein